ncbi:MAG: tRNA (cytidine(34)-2'-O)-methyltransferase [Candidatus Aminicenantes bacterium]|nr:tRNA (cytidine(34)-2'-O)-methyltransferase [Candidatus Aminicenantes bacterium]
MKMHVVLYEPRIPQNTGNIARTCAAVGAVLHLIKPLGFFVDDKSLKRAGLDYWEAVDIRYHSNLAEFMALHGSGNLAFITKKADRTYNQMDVSKEIFLVFGKETWGLPPDLLQANPMRCFRIPMKEEARSLNLASAAAVVIFDVLRRMRFPGLIRSGGAIRLQRENR